MKKKKNGVRARKREEKKRNVRKDRRKKNNKYKEMATELIEIYENKIK